MQSMMILKKICDEIERLARTFIWGTTDGRIKMLLIGWDSVYQPKDHSGLGMRQLRDQNISFLLKLGYNVVSNEEVLWSVMGIKSNAGRTPGSLMLAPLSTISLITSILVPTDCLENRPQRMAI
ncbi:hypothetical protein Golob_000383 [Gossypium lobatum]|uniref:Uncharacterized protein n=1 Tax=Gossypium lobatum TaxID=34289 RepID=A0A7J8N8D4_9ROSI|nr:hypothetical protein [Gossypium lobatum]